MAVLNKKEEKIKAVIGRLPKNYSQDDFVKAFIQYFSSDWGKIKKAYIKQNQDKEAGTVVNMPKPELYLKQLLELYLEKEGTEAPVIVEVPTEKPAKITKTEKPVKAKIKAEETGVETEKPAAIKKATKAKKEVTSKIEKEVVEAKPKKTTTPKVKDK